MKKEKIPEEKIEKKNVDNQTENEFLDIVNDLDEVIGNDRWDIVLGKNLCRRVAHIFIVNDQGELLIQLRGKNMKFGPLKYDSSSAGHIISGEEYIDGAKRELEEELGIKTDLTFLKKFHFQNEIANQFVSLYVGKHNGPFTIQKSEIEHVMFHHLNDIKAMLLTKPDSYTKTFRECFKIYLDYLVKNKK